MLTFHVNEPAHLDAFIALNEAWITEYFELEEGDRRLAADPGAIARSGGVVISAIEDGEVVGVGAVVPLEDGVCDFIRFAVDPSRRSQGIGRQIINLAIEHARAMGGKQLTLYTNTKLEAAQSLYKSLGFVVTHRGPHHEYRRPDLVMSLDL
ncbi:GNAT family N-acetyltransferase [Posidoniimonas polymericola]|nr:GNAT family N-acetyltransferase [Posidoniimonas polymericola]